MRPWHLFAALYAIAWVIYLCVDSSGLPLVLWTLTTTLLAWFSAMTSPLVKKVKRPADLEW